MSDLLSESDLLERNLIQSEQEIHDFMECKIMPKVSTILTPTNMQLLESTNFGIHWVANDAFGNCVKADVRKDWNKNPLESIITSVIFKKYMRKAWENLPRVHKVGMLDALIRTNPSELSSLFSYPDIVKQICFKHFSTWDGLKSLTDIRHRMEIDY